jgi:maltooligosyltrehalose trehalohydrolase
VTAPYEPTLGSIPNAHGTHFRAWAPKPGRVELVIEGANGQRTVPMTRDEAGYWTARTLDGPGARYGYLLDGEGPFPDPCSRSQPEGVHALSEVVDAAAFAWSDGGWTPPPCHEAVIYEMHVGTFTREGTFDAALTHLPGLAAMGVNAVELMPIAEFAGDRNWGYDGVALFAPESSYGGPDGLRRFVDAAHRAGLAVLLDVVYNHFGPAGNYTGLYAAEYLDPTENTPWGAAINFLSDDVRRFYRENLLHWVHEYHIDGFRFDATNRIIDRSTRHILGELADAVRACPRPGQPPAWLIAETHENDPRYFAATPAGHGFDAVWADDFHHQVRVLICGDRDGYFANFSGIAGELAETIAHGFFYEGAIEPETGAPRGSPARDVPWSAFVYCLQNHDQAGNRAFGERLTATASHADLRAATLLLLLLPQVPMLFQGQECFAQAPFQYFTDHDEDLGRLVTEGRRREFATFGAFIDPQLRHAIPDPQDEATFLRSKLDRDEAAAGVGRLALDFHAALLAIRHGDPLLCAYRRERLPIATATNERALLLGFEATGERRWLAANFGEEVALPFAASADVVLHTEEARFGGNRSAPRFDDGALVLPRHSAAWLAPD